ncbi:DUF885 domain-containing protein [Microlunatus capsulatus]|uniref:Uncharacterized protein (DUF885 family) n=1 Tax=Microlunatus capsulatus TaxID=99117 RepID=A0ABS4Z8L1_9ACTN|nr:DUF885 domain-containing protein [Microlunatus capsulatus]MBP2417386.1 uncharacterized protein (DUF885 family) [Microlunatus capsulatus]
MTDPLPTPRQLADGYVDRLCVLDPTLGTVLGRIPAPDGLPDLSPAGLDAVADLQRTTLAALDRVEAAGAADEQVEERCARLLRERLSAELALHASSEGLRSLSNLFSPVHQVREAFQLMATDTDEDWGVVARRMARVPAALRGYQETLAAGAAQGLFSAPLQVRTVVEQLAEWSAGRWFTSVAADGPDGLRGELDRAAADADDAVAALHDFLRDTYAPQAAGTPDAVGRERYARFARYWNGIDLGTGTALEDAYAFGWAEFRRIRDEQRVLAEQVLPGSGPAEAMQWLREHGEAVVGVEAVRARLQQMMDEAMDALDGTHVDLAPPIRRVEAMIAPPGSAGAPYYTEPSQDFSRPGRTWLPTLGRDRFPLWDLVSTWYHEGVPGHHLQLAQWTYVAGSLSTYQTTVGAVGADVEGWALYAERLMDELGFLTDPGARMGYLDGQQLRAVRVVIDIGMHVGLPVPEDADGVLADHRGEPWTPALGRAFLGEHCGGDPAFLDSELVRYLGMPGQAISYKLGERAWLAGRERARAAHGDAFDLKAWHMAALSQGSLGLDDLVEALAVL